MGADTVLHGDNPLWGPILSFQYLASKFRGSVMVIAASDLAASCSATLSIVQQGSRVHDLNIGPFNQCQALGHAIHA
jgi:hypothetical protein